MNGAESLIRTSVDAGVDVCFANPGTTEMPLVLALDRVPGMRSVLGLFEGVCTGAADGYGRMTGRPALTLLHLGPGFANGIANLHNARRARTPVVNVIGDHASWHLDADAPLTSDIESLARPVSSWVERSASAEALGSDVARAIEAARRPPGGVATVIAPQDAQWEDVSGPAAAPKFVEPASPDRDAVAATAAALRAGGAVVLLGAGGLAEAGVRAAGRLVAGTGCRVLLETFPSRVERGAGLPAIERLPYFPEQASEALAGASAVVLAGALDPVAFFGYPGGRSRLTPDGCPVVPLATPDQAVVAALEAVADELDAPEAVGAEAQRIEGLPSGPLDAGKLALALASAQPEGAIVVDEAATSGLGWWALSTGAPRHTVLSLTGGAIGQGLPCAVGAAIACPDRPVIAFQADGSGAYTLQSLWTAAREQLNVTVLLCSNRAYRILQVELARAGAPEPGPAAQSLTGLSSPELDWVALARGFGVPGERVEDAPAAAAAIARALAEPGPHLIEAVL
ncbi:MAG: acetolactate synthase large subunit [Proteobacteria bacterium]|nr:acetolactate synthase large subunit [Pseudomonadota bacterium]